MTDIVERLRQGVDPDDIPETERAMDAGAAEIERLKTENENLRHWKALDKPLTAAMEIANSHLAPLRADNERLREQVTVLRELRDCDHRLIERLQKNSR